MTAPFVVTSRLGNILQMVSLSHQTGILRVIRGQGIMREMGQIRFIDGEPVSALLGQLTGEAALGVLNNWGECYYAFDELSVADVASLASLRNSGSAYASSDAGTGSSMGPAPGPLTAPGVAGGFDPSSPSTPPFSPDYNSVPSRTSPTSPLSESSWPVYSYQQSGLFSSSDAPTDLNTLGNASGAQPTAQANMQNEPSAMGYSAQWSAPREAAPAIFAPSNAPAAARPIAPTLVPRRSPLAEQIDTLPLDRRERMVLLLVDGQRTVADLWRLTRRTEAEVQAVLTHLEMLGLVSLGG